MVSQREQTVPVAELRDVVKTFGTVRALNGVRLTVGQGETVALLGPNGAGKTTAISLMLGLRMAIPRWLELGGLLLVGMIPFVALGLLIGYLTGPNSAAAVANLIFLPLDFLPDVMQQVAPYLPAYHTGQLGWGVLGAGDGKGFGYHLLWLAGYTAVFLALALVAYWRDEGKNFG